MFSLTQGQATSAHVVNTWGGDEHLTVIDWTVFDSSVNILARSEHRRYYRDNLRILNMELACIVLPRGNARLFAWYYGSKALREAPIRERRALIISLRRRRFTTSPTARPPCSYRISSNEIEALRKADGRCISLP